MSYVVDQRTTNIDVQTYSSIQTVKYSLAVKKTSAVDHFKKKDPEREKVDPILIRNRSSAWRKNNQRKGDNIEKKKKGGGVGTEPQENGQQMTTQ